MKTAFSPVDGREILDRLRTVPILSWRYRTEDPAARHIGPTAQDFHQAFQVGTDEGYINSMDADGIAMAARLIRGSGFVTVRPVRSEDVQKKDWFQPAQIVVSMSAGNWRSFFRWCRHPGKGLKIFAAGVSENERRRL